MHNQQTFCQDQKRDTKKETCLKLTTKISECHK